MADHKDVAAEGAAFREYIEAKLAEDEAHKRTTAAYWRWMQICGYVKLKPLSGSPAVATMLSIISMMEGGSGA